jgi:chromosome segregation ATPase
MMNEQHWIENYKGMCQKKDDALARIAQLESALKKCSVANRRAFHRYENFHKMLAAVDAVVDAALKDKP